MRHLPVVSLFAAMLFACTSNSSSPSPAPIPLITANGSGTAAPVNTVTQPPNTSAVTPSAGATPAAGGGVAAPVPTASTVTDFSTVQVFQNNCYGGGCHGTSLPLTYAKTEIADSVNTGRMPLGRRLTAADLSTIQGYLK